MLRDVILLFKYKKFRVLGKELAGFAVNTLGREASLWWGADALLAVPLHSKRERQRGFNQARTLTEEISKRVGIDFQKRALVKAKNVLPQTSMEAKQRKNNIKDAFRPAKNAEIKGKTFVLIDDVYTTGATIQECSKVLLESGASEVRALTIARA
jgi:ComF family protein